MSYHKCKYKEECEIKKKPRRDGICPDCGLKPRRKDRWYCEECDKVRRRLYAKKYFRIHKNVCNKCGGVCSCHSKICKKCQFNEIIHRTGSEKNNWTNKPKYTTMHNWVRKHKIKPSSCGRCGKITTDLELAKISKEYTRNIEDYEYMCCSCHHKMDKRKEYCIHGHKMEGYNVYINTRGNRCCRECIKLRKKRYKNNVI